MFPPGGPPFGTQRYVAGDPGNAEDFLNRRLPADRRHLVTVPCERTAGSEAELVARVEIVLGATLAG